MDKKNAILFLGDVVPYKPFKFSNPYSTVINLECPITTNNAPALEKINLRVEKNYLENIFNDKLICACLGNNHILDYGEIGLESTILELEKLNTNWFGINYKSVDNYQPKIIEVNKTKIAFIAAVCLSSSPVVELNSGIHLNTLDIDKINERVKEIRKSVHRIIIYIHWGIEESSYPSTEDIVKARKLIEAGVDIIICSHAHAPQPIEKYKNGIIAYNLGNFIMPEMKNIPTYFDGNGTPRATYSKRLMIWNRISWGILIDLNSLEFIIKKYIFICNRIIELPYTTLDKYTKLKHDPFHASYEQNIKSHLKRRALYRRITNFINKPHVPKKIKNMLWK